jgi:hypothetical protein
MGISSALPLTTQDASVPAGPDPVPAAPRRRSRVAAALALISGAAALIIAVLGVLALAP